MPLAALASVGGNLISGFMGQKSQDKDRKMQKEFAQHGIRWKVEDAKAAGLHPLAALGAQTSSFSPVAVGGSPMGNAIAQSGQDISRAINSTRTAGERIDAYTKTIQDLNIQRMGLENQLLGSQIAKINQAGMPPPFPSGSDPYLVEGQSGSGIRTKALDVRATNPDNPSIEAGAVAEQGFGRTPKGWAPLYSHDAKDRLEDDFIGGLAWSLRNRLLPSLDSRHHNPPGVPLDKGEMWYYDPIRQEYVKVPRRGTIWRGFPGRHAM